MSRRPYFPFRQAPLKIVHRFSNQGADHLLSEIREHTLNGARVRVCRWKAPFFYIVRNDPLFLVLSADGPPIGSFENVAAALAAGDKAITTRRQSDDGHPMGVA